MRGLVVAIAMFASAAITPSLGHAAAPTDQDIVDSYQYMLSRWLVLRQESLDLEEGFKWNEIIHRKPGGVTWANPNLDVRLGLLLMSPAARSSICPRSRAAITPSRCSTAGVR